MKKILGLLLIIIGVWVFVDQFSQKKPSSLTDQEPQSTPISSRFPSSVSVQGDCSGPCLSLTIRSSSETLMNDPEADILSLNLLKNDQLQLKLINSKAYDSVLTYGSNEADFSNQTLVVNWTKADLREFTLTQEKNKFRYYRTQWRMVGERKFKTAVFSIDSFDIKSPEFILHHQPVNAGIQQMTFLSVEKNGEAQELTQVAPLVLARNSLLGYEIIDSSKTMQDCVYQAPNGSEESCQAWSRSRVIRSVSEQDIGLHKIQIMTESGRYDFEFRILNLQ